MNHALSEKQLGQLMGQADNDLYAGSQPYQPGRVQRYPSYGSVPMSTFPKLPSLPKMFRFFIRNPVFKKFMEAYRKFAKEYNEMVQLQDKLRQAEQDEWNKKAKEFEDFRDKMPAPWKPKDFDDVPDDKFPAYPYRDKNWSYRSPDLGKADDITAKGITDEHTVDHNLEDKIKELNERLKDKRFEEEEKAIKQARLDHDKYLKPQVHYDKPF